MTNLTNVARLALRCGRVCYGAAFAGLGNALLGAVWFFTVWLALWCDSGLASRAWAGWGLVSLGTVRKGKACTPARWCWVWYGEIVPDEAKYGRACSRVWCWQCRLLFGKVRLCWARQGKVCTLVRRDEFCFGASRYGFKRQGKRRRRAEILSLSFLIKERIGKHERSNSV